MWSCRGEGRLDLDRRVALERRLVHERRIALGERMVPHAMSSSLEPTDRYRLPIFPLPTVLLPGAGMPLHIFEPRYRTMVRDCLDADHGFGMVYHDWDEQGPFLSEEGRVGCVAEIRQHELLDDGRSLIVVEGIERFRIVDGIESEHLYFEALVTPFVDATALQGAALEARRTASIELFQAVVKSMSKRSGELPDFEPDGEVSFLLAQTIQVDPPWQQRLLETGDEATRLTYIDNVLRAALG